MGHRAEISGSTRVTLCAVTKNDAEMLGLADEVGSIRPAYLADSISVAADPLRDPWALGHVALVMEWAHAGICVSAGIVPAPAWGTSGGDPRSTPGLGVRSRTHA